MINLFDAGMIININLMIASLLSAHALTIFRTHAFPHLHNIKYKNSFRIERRAPIMSFKINSLMRKRLCLVFFECPADRPIPLSVAVVG